MKKIPSSINLRLLEPLTPSLMPTKGNVVSSVSSQEQKQERKLGMSVPFPFPTHPLQENYISQPHHHLLTLPPTSSHASANSDHAPFSQDLSHQSRYVPPNRSAQYSLASVFQGRNLRQQHPLTAAFCR